MLPDEAIGPVRLAFVVTVAALPVMSPVAVPMLGVVNVGELLNTISPVPVAPVGVTPSIVGCPLIVGVVIVGEASITNLVPVPVCDVIEVVLPDDAIGPVRSALVVATIDGDDTNPKLLNAVATSPVGCATGVVP